MREKAGEIIIEDDRQLEERRRKYSEMLESKKEK
jgi:hypothetical protein